MSVTGAAEGAGLMVVKLSAVAGKSYQVAVGQMVAAGRMAASQTPGSGRGYLVVARQTASAGWADLLAAW